MLCASCGRQLAPADSFCDNCGTSASPAANGIVLERSPARPVFTSTRAQANPQDRAQPFAAPPPAEPPAFVPPARVPRPVSPPRFRLACDEQILQSYEAVQLRAGLFKRKRGQGTLWVTDARVVFYAWVYPRGTQRESWLLQQTKLEDISGLETHVSRRISLGLLVLTVLFGFAAVGNFLVFDIIGAFFLAVLAGLCLLLLIRGASRRGGVGVTITSRGDGNSPIMFGHAPKTGIIDAVVRLFMSPVLFFFPSYSAFDVMLGDPAEDANELVHELGALVLDLQTRGKMAYAHWGIRETPRNGYVGSPS